LIGEAILQNYARASKYIGLHFDAYEDFILPPIIKQEIWDAQPTDKGHITVYLLSYSKEILLKHFSALKEHRFEVFSNEIKYATQIGNVKLIPVDKYAFATSLINCSGIITGAGFETPAEALYLNKKLMVIPIKGQYEQQCNAAALEQLGVRALKEIDENFPLHFTCWMMGNQPQVQYRRTTEQIIDKMMALALTKDTEKFAEVQPYLQPA